jgi:hypothetical protein
MRDPDFIRDAKQSKLDVAPMNGEEAQAVLARILAAPRAVIERVRKIRGQ